MKARISLILKIVAVTLLLAAMVIASAFLYGRERTWELLAGPADLGAVDLATLTRRSTRNDALLCRDNFCPAAIAGLPGSIYKVGAADLAAEFDAGIAGEAHLQRVDDGADPLYRRYVQRSAGLRFPDTVDVRFFPLSEDRSYLVIYSRSQLGYGDFGVNRKRILRWIGHIEHLPHED